ncbi:hypothetical protein IWX90DRAFT_10118 [Phyllosticta citrichinensis]|uniref:Uncharacterized protein n=1 Tax=Phyllosticta citrichinensis TaxID=1130410 RepID=A0ABR1Y5L1_9PEZI
MACAQQQREMTTRKSETGGRKRANDASRQAGRQAMSRDIYWCCDGRPLKQRMAGRSAICKPMTQRHVVIDNTRDNTLETQFHAPSGIERPHSACQRPRMRVSDHGALSCVRTPASIPGRPKQQRCSQPAQKGARRPSAPSVSAARPSLTHSLITLTQHLRRASLASLHFHILFTSTRQFSPPLPNNTSTTTPTTALLPSSPHPFGVAVRISSTCIPCWLHPFPALINRPYSSLRSLADHHPPPTFNI